MHRLGWSHTVAFACAALAFSGCVTFSSELGAEAASPTPPATSPPRFLVTSRPTVTPVPTPTLPATPTPTRRPGETPTDPSLTPRPGESPRPTISTEGACGDPEFSLSGYRWEGTYDWRFNRRSTPEEYDPIEVLDVLVRSVTNITNAFNDCGLPDAVDIEARYRGTTDEEPCEGGTYGLNVIGFGDVPERLGSDTIAYTCPYTDNVTDDYVEADIVINRDVDWALSIEQCRGFEELLEATMTHELGHVFGLGHVSERRHGDLTMSTRSNGACNEDEVSLGLGDILGLEELYGEP